jgi:hypothetical protein
MVMRTAQGLRMEAQGSWNCVTRMRKEGGSISGIDVKNGWLKASELSAAARAPAAVGP